MDFERIKRAYRNWRRMHVRARPPTMPEPFFATDDVNELHRFFRDTPGGAESDLETAEVLNGQCAVCGDTVDFLIDQANDGSPVNWRETLTCPKCGMINRWRGCLHLFEALCIPFSEDRIYLTEALSPVCRKLETRFPLLVSSEFLPGAGPGEVIEMHGRPVRHEDVTHLSFEDRSLEAVLCFDVLEHVPDYRRALREFHRVLVKGGQLLISVPFSFQQETLVRAVVKDDGTIEHLVEPCYHGDPLSAGGVLSYYDFGMDLLADMGRVGFSECFAVCYSNPEWGYLEKNVVFLARKLKN
jgi:SAM-dependent methyltransferase